MYEQPSNAALTTRQILLTLPKRNWPFLRLKEAGCLTVQTTIKEDAVRGFIKRNSYQIKPVEKDFFLLNNGFFTRNYSAKMAGFLLLLKAICLNNTNTIQ